MKNKILHIFLVTFLLITSCVTKKTTTTSSTNTKLVELPPKLIFLNYNLKKTSNDSRSISLINKIITEGSLKKQVSNQNEVAEVGDLMYHQLDENSKILQHEIIKNPLVKIFEYIDDSKSFQMQKVELDSAQISLKLKLEPSTKYITITHIRDLNSKPEVLIKTPIN